MSDKGEPNTGVKRPVPPQRRSGIVSSLVASFDQPEEPARGPIYNKPKPTPPSASTKPELASSVRTDHPPVTVTPRKEEPKKEEPKKEEPKKEDPKKDSSKKDDGKKDDGKKDDKKSDSSVKREDSHHTPRSSHRDHGDDHHHHDSGHHTPRSERHNKDDDGSDSSSHHHGSHSSSHRKGHESSSVHNSTSNESINESGSAAEVPNSESSATSEPKKDKDAKEEEGAEDGKDDEDKGKLSKRLGGKKKGLFGSLNLKSWRKSKSVSAEEGEAAVAGANGHEEEGEEPETPSSAAGDDNESPSTATASGRRSKHKSIFGKHSKKEETPSFEITRRASVASTAEASRSTSQFIVRKPAETEHGSAPGEEGGATLHRATSMINVDRSGSCGPLSDDGDEEDGEPLDKEEKMRRRVLREIIETEESYVNDLRIIVDVIIAQMKAKKVLDQVQINGLFSGIEVLRNFNNFLLQKLQGGEPVGKSFELMASFMKGYVQYCVNVPKAEEKLKQYSKDSSFRAFLAELSTVPEMHQLGVGDFLMKPVQRLCKYPLLLRELISHTPKDSPDYPNLNNAYNEIQKTVAAVNEGKRADEDHQKVITIFEKLEGFNDRAKFITPSRSYIHEETLRELLANGTEQEMHYIFFNDLILRCKTHAGRYALKSFIPRDVLLVAPVTSPIETRKVSQKPMFLLDVVHAGVDKFTIICDTEQDRNRILEIAAGNTSNGNNYTRSTKDLIELYNLQPKTKLAPLATASDPPGTVVFSVLCVTCGELVRFVSIDKDNHKWQDVINRIARKFGISSVKSFSLCQHDKAANVVGSLDKLCDIAKNNLIDPQFDLSIESNDVNTADVKKE